MIKLLTAILLSNFHRFYCLYSKASSVPERSIRTWSTRTVRWLYGIYFCLIGMLDCFLMSKILFFKINYRRIVRICSHWTYSHRETNSKSSLFSEYRGGGRERERETERERENAREQICDWFLWTRVPHPHHFSFPVSWSYWAHWAHEFTAGSRGSWKPVPL